MSWQADEDGADRARLAEFRDELYSSLGMRRDVLFEACDALACRPERVHMLAELCLEPECRRGHGGLYDALNCGEVRIGRLRRALSALPLRRWDDGRIRLACDVSNWLRPDDDASEVTAAQVRDVTARLVAAGHWHEGDPDVIVVLDSGYDLTRLAWL